MLEIDKKARALIFDLDGTLVNTIKIHFNAWQKVSNKYGFSFDMDYFFSLTGKPVEQVAQAILDRFKPELSLAQFIQEKEEAFYSTIDEMELIEPVVQLVKTANTSLPMAVGTGSSLAMATTILEKAKLFHYFKVLKSADDVRHHKPHPETFLACAEALGIPPHECQVFEDGQLGLEAAVAANMIVTDVKPYYTEPVW